MTVYFLTIFLSLFCSSIVSFGKDLYLKKSSRIFVFLLLVLPLILRQGIGTDYKNYVNIFNSIQLDSMVFSDLGWLLINKIVIYLNLGVQFIFVISGFLTIYFFYKDLTDKELFSFIIIFLCFLYFPSYNIIRQILSLSIIYYAIDKKNKYVKFCFFIFACSIHFATIVLILLFLPINVKKRNHYVFFMVGIILFLVFRIVPIQVIVAKLVSYLNPRLSLYITSQVYSNGINSSGLTLYLEVLYYILLYYYLDTKKISQKYFNICTFLFLSSMINYGAVFNFFIFARFKYFFYLFPLVCLKNERKSDIFVFINKMFLILFLLLSIKSNVINGNNGITPYNSILN